MARNGHHCRDLIDLIASVLKQKWYIINPVYEQQPRLFIQLFSQQISMINLSKSEIEKVLNTTCLNISSLKLDSEVITTNIAEESKEQEFILRLAREVLKYFDEERATFRFWERGKEIDDLIDRIYSATIKYMPQLKQLSFHSSKRKQLIADLAMSNFTITDLERIIKQAINEIPAYIEKRLHEETDRDANALPLIPPGAAKRPKSG